MPEIYFDNASTTKVRPEVIEAMMPYFDKYYGNPSGANKYALEAKTALENFRQTIARLLDVEPGEIIFTSGATESNNLAIQGLLRQRNNKKDHIICSKVEHESVLRPCMALEKEGYDLHTVRVDSTGKILLEELEVLLKPETILVSIMAANNEIGTIQPLKEIADLLKGHNAVFHVDAVQALGKIPMKLNNIGVQMASFSSHKIYGPKGVGALYVDKDISLRPLFFGGGQEWNLRSGTTALPLIAGFSKALELAISEMADTRATQNEMQTYLIKEIKEIDGFFINGTEDLSQRLPANIHFATYSLEGRSLVDLMGDRGICVSSGSSCSGSETGVSRVLRSIGLKPSDDFTSVRISLGKDNTMAECEYFVSSLLEVMADLKTKSGAQ